MCWRSAPFIINPQRGALVGRWSYTVGQAKRHSEFCSYGHIIILFSCENQKFHETKYKEIVFYFFVNSLLNITQKCHIYL